MHRPKKLNYDSGVRLPIPPSISATAFKQVCCSKWISKNKFYTPIQGDQRGKAVG